MIPSSAGSRTGGNTHLFRRTNASWRDLFQLASGRLQLQPQTKLIAPFANAIRNSLRSSVEALKSSVARASRSIVIAEGSIPKLGGIVEIDETYIGGKQKSKGVCYGKKQKQVGVRQRKGPLRFVHSGGGNFFS